MCSLNLFPIPQHSQYRTCRESNGNLEEGIDDVVIIDEGQIYPTIEIKSESIIKPSIVDERIENIFIEKNLNVWKRALYCYQYNGFISSLQYIRDFHDSNNSFAFYIIQRISCGLLYLWNLLLAFYVFLFPFALKSNAELCDEFSKTLLWSNGIIRAFEWHPNRNKCAIALINDTIYIYYPNNSFVSLLKHAQQRAITDISWRPNSDHILAVAADSLVFIWNVNPDSKLIRPPNDCIKIINSMIASPLISARFDMNGQYLMACSPQSSRLALIKMDANPEDIKLIRKFFTSFTKLFWSPDKKRLLALTTSAVIRVFENENWSSREWRLNNICQTACWSEPDGRILLIYPRNSTIIYALLFYDKAQPNDVGGCNHLIEVLDISENVFPNGVKVGGCVHDMIWDRYGERLAISFKDNPEYIAICKTKIKPNLEIIPLGFVHGLAKEIPLVMSFNRNFKNGSLLTICWNSGFVSYIPLQYDWKATNSYSNGTPRSLTAFCISPQLDDSAVSPINGTPKKSTFQKSHLNSLIANDSVISPRRPVLFSNLLNQSSNGSIELR